MAKKAQISSRTTKFTVLTPNKLYVTGVVEWIIKRPGIIVSVEQENGQPVTDLKKINFTVGRMGSGSVWVKLNVSSVQNSGQGFYKVHIFKNKVGNKSYNWQSYQSNNVFTVEVERADGQIMQRGQCLAINKCCDDDGMGGD